MRGQWQADAAGRRSRLGKVACEPGYCRASVHGKLLAGLWARPARGGAALLSAEDDPADTIRPRLDAAGADVSGVNLIQAVEWYDGDAGERVTRSFSLERDAAALEEAIEQTPDCRLVIIDPISAYLGGTDSYKNADIRGLLTPLSQLAQRLRVAVLAVTHLNKSAGPAMYRSMGSLAFVAAARAVWAVVKDQEDASKRLMLPIKNNLAADTSGLSYTVVVPSGVPSLAWSDQPVTITVDDALAAGRDDDPRDSERRDAKAWLQEVLAGWAGRSERTEAGSCRSGVGGAHHPKGERCHEGGSV